MSNEQRSDASGLAIAPRTEWEPNLIAGLGLIAASAMVTAAGVAKRFLASASTSPYTDAAWTGIAAAVFVVAMLWTLRSLRSLPDPRDDCDRYGRHMVGLTFLLLVLGLCNATGTSVLALSGELGVSAADIERISAPKQREEAEKQHDAARQAVRVAVREQQRAEIRRRRAATAMTALCSAEQSPDCTQARAALDDTERVYDDKQAALEDALETEHHAQSCCDKGKRALFFLLSLSTMMALFGASFYVVNRVRGMRPHRTPTLLDDEDEPNATRQSRESLAQAKSGGLRDSIAEQNAATTSTVNAHTEPFDVHAFWSGAFFRVGEAVLFTFAFFWLIWTSDNHERIVWLPMLGLFVGMFVKTGEAIVFRLGMRVLFAVEALLPAAPVAPRTAATRTTPPTPNRPSGEHAVQT